MIRGFMTTLGVLAALFTVFVLVPAVGFVLVAAFAIHDVHRDVVERKQQEPAYDAVARHAYWSGLRRQHWEDERIRATPARWNKLDAFQQRELKSREDAWYGRLKKEFDKELEGHEDLRRLIKADVEGEKRDKVA